MHSLYLLPDSWRILQVDQYISNPFNACLAVYTEGLKDPINGKTGAGVFIPMQQANIGFLFNQQKLLL